MAAANEAGDEMWQLNATVLVAQSEGKLYREFKKSLRTPELFN